MSTFLPLYDTLEIFYEHLKIYTGYYKSSDGKFYKSKSGSTYSNEIPGEVGRMFIDVSTDVAYIYDADYNSNAGRFIPIGGNTTINSDNVMVTAGPVDSPAQEITLTAALSKKNSIYYGKSTTAVSTAAKVITLQGIDPSSNWELKKGVIIAVAFAKGTNTASNPTFNVNGSGAISVKYPVYGSDDITTSVITSTNKEYAGGKLTNFYYYDGTNWVWFFGEKNEGTVKYVQINGTTFGPDANGIVNAGTIVREIQLPSGTTPAPGTPYNLNPEFVSEVSYNSTSKQIERTKNGSAVKVADKSDIEEILEATNGVATLGSDGKVPSAQLPSFVDDVIDSYVRSGATALSSSWLSKTNGGAALTPEADKIYVVVGPSSATGYLNKTYRWSGSTYVEISASIVVGTLPGNAFDGAEGATLKGTVNTHIADTAVHVQSGERTSWNAKSKDLKWLDGSTVTPDPTNHTLDLSGKKVGMADVTADPSTWGEGNDNLAAVLTKIEGEISSAGGYANDAVYNVYYNTSDNKIYKQKGHASSSSTTIEPIIDMSPFAVTQAQLNTILGITT